MNPTRFDFLFRVESPYVYVGLGESERLKWIPSYFYSRPGLSVCVRVLRGRKMRTAQALMDEFASALQFFEGFGENWYALKDCLACLDEWLPAEAYVLVVETAEELLQEECPDQMAALVLTLHEVGESWAQPIKDNGRFNRPAIPFHVLLLISEGDAAAPATDRVIRAAQDGGLSVGKIGSDIQDQAAPIAEAPAVFPLP
jgi:hypothetical protein